METMVASQKQKEFFGEIWRLPDLVLGLKREEVCALNAHGRFQLSDKSWKNGTTETLVAFCPSASEQPEMTLTGEPLVHLHVDWRAVRYCLIRDRHLPLINTEKEIVFSQGKNPDTRVFWFYSKNTAELADLIKKNGTEIELTPPK